MGLEKYINYFSEEEREQILKRVQMRFMMDRGIDKEEYLAFMADKEAGKNYSETVGLKPAKDFS